MTPARRDGLALVTALKRTVPARGPGLSLPVPGSLRLRPVATRDVAPGHLDVVRLTRWRNRHVSAFLTEFEATPERTARWLRELVGPDDGRIVFMVDDAAERTFGYMGLAFIDWVGGSFEIDGVVRGLDGPPGGMSVALVTLIDWALAQLGLAEPRVRVRSDNPHAVAFYRTLGFEPQSRRPLRGLVEPDMVHWVEDDAADPDGPALVHMVRGG
jgi:RimJ/RimL family protein N-acetyltransferase